MDESWLQFLIAQLLTDHFPKCEVEKQDNNTYDIRVSTPSGKTFVVQITEEDD